MDALVLQMVTHSPTAFAIIFTANVLRKQIQALRLELKQEIHTLNAQIAVIVERTDSHTERINRLEDLAFKK